MTIQSLIQDINEGKEKLDELMGLENTDSLEDKLETIMPYQKHQTRFEDYLENVFNKLHPGVLDDDLEDSFQGWLAQLDVEELIKYADEYKQST